MPPDLTRAARDVLAERERQKTAEYFDAEHDDKHVESQMAMAAIQYTAPQWLRDWFDRNDIIVWPWEWCWFKPQNQRRDLVRAGALILAEIERLDRKEARDAQ